MCIKCLYQWISIKNCLNKTIQSGCIYCQYRYFRSATTKFFGSGVLYLTGSKCLFLQEMATKTETVKENAIKQKNTSDSETKNYKTESSASENSESNLLSYVTGIQFACLLHYSLPPIFLQWIKNEREQTKLIWREIIRNNTYT